MPATSGQTNVIEIPGFQEPFSLDLPPGLAALREKALALHRGPQGAVVELGLVDAETWAEHTDDEPWLVWRARRCAARLKRMPIDVEPGELLVGKPRFRQSTEEDARALDRARAGAASPPPPFPGGDAGHFHPDYEKLFRVGVAGLIHETIERGRRAQDPEKKDFYLACRIALEGLQAFALRAADACEAMIAREPAEAAEWRARAARCRRAAADPPATFRDAMQLLFLVEMALWFGEDHHLTCPGRLDQTLRRFYEADLAAGRLTRRGAFELLCALYIQLNRVLWPGSAVAVMVGGRDAAGRDVTNDLTYLCLAARLATRLVYPTVAVAWHENAPRELLDFGVRLLAAGVGDPAFFNDEVISQGLREHGVSAADCHNYMNSTCVEIKVVGRSNMWVTQPYINLAQGLLNALERAAAEPPAGFDAFQELVRADLAETIRAAAERLDRVWSERGRTGGFPLASCFVLDCLERGLDFDRGGARYNWVENSFVGLANLVDGLLAVKHLVYELKEFSLADLQRILQSDYAGCEDVRQRLANSLPKYGNDDAEADALAAEWAQWLIEQTESHTVGLHSYVPGFFCWVMHERLGAQTGATPDGRRAGQPLADGAGAAQGRERRGPTASVLSTTKWSHRRVLGGLVHNAKFSKRLLQSDAARDALRAVIETYLRRGGFEIQINVVGRDTLLDAQKRPELYPDLLVRVAGYSDYFVHLNKNMQDEIIARTEHEV